MIYDYVCDACGRVQTAMRSVAKRNAGPVCCGAGTRRRIATPNIATRHWCYDDFPSGMSSRDLVEQAKASDKAYEASWGGHVPSGPPPVKSMDDIYKEVLHEAHAR